MALVSPSVPIHLQDPRMRGFRRTGSALSTGSGGGDGDGGGGGLREIEEEALETQEMAEEDKVYVALGKELKEGRSTLLCALQNTSTDSTVVLVHVHRPAQMIPVMGAKFAASQLTDDQVRDYRQREREKLDKILDEYMSLCSIAAVRAEKLVIEVDDAQNSKFLSLSGPGIHDEKKENWIMVGKGLVELIALHGINKLVMGTKQFSRRTKLPKSKTAMIVYKHADPFCKICFVCKGDMVCTREAGLNGYGIGLSPTDSPASRSSSSSESEHMRSSSFSPGPTDSFNWLFNPMQGILRRRSRSVNYDSHGGGVVVPLPLEGDAKILTTRSTPSLEGSVIGPGEAISRSSQASDHSSPSLSEELSDMGPLPMPKDEESEEESVMLPSVHEPDEDLQFLSSRQELEDVGVDDEVYAKLQNALTEAENLRREAYDESCRRQKAERDAIEASRRANTSVNLYTKELKQRKEVEETLAREQMEVEKLKTQRDQVFEELQKAHEHGSALELRIADSDCLVEDLEEKLSSAQHLLNSLRQELEELQRERDDAVKESEELRRMKEEATTSTHRGMNYSVFSYAELEQATNSFANSMKIGEGGYGSVFKGFLHHTMVAIKMLNPESMQGKNEFHQEVNVLSRVRHPHLVTLIGACPEAWALVYEFCNNGSLEDRLTCKDNTPPLTWQARTRIAAEMCSALIFLHSNKPHSVVHGDLKPANILIDANFESKLGDFGICRILNQSSTTTLYCHTNPKGTFVYMDPEFFASGDITAYSDVYSFGVILLRLLTGRPALGIIREVQEALNKGHLHGILDPTAGEWPFVQAKQLTHLALKCCEIKRKKRPNLAVDAWKVLEPMARASSTGTSSLSFGLDSEDSSCIPSYFICPIFQEIMMDPHLADDGFTYEAEALKGWLDSGHDTSPMTNLKLARCDLIPNRALRSAIQEWLQQHK